MADEVTSWLASIKLERYADAFISNGYDDMSMIPVLTEDDLNAMEITLPGHRKRFLMNAAKYKATARDGQPATQPSAPAEPGPARPKPAPRPKPRPRSTVGTPAAETPTPPSRPSRPVSIALAPPDVPPTRPSKPAVSAVPEAETEEASDSGRKATDQLPPVPPASSKPAAAPTSPAPEPMPTPVIGDDGVAISIQNEATGVMTPIAIDQFSTAGTVLASFVQEARAHKQDAGNVWALYESFDCPPIERRLPDYERVLDAQARWPKTDGCMFLVREIPQGYVGLADPKKSSKLAKRGGTRKSWKTRFFITNETQLSYYPKTPTKQKDLDNPLGNFVFVNACIYDVKYYKKAPRSRNCFVIKPITEPMWVEGTEKEIYDQFDNQCKFMCALGPTNRADWVATMLRCQELLVEKGEIYGTAEGCLKPPDSFENDAEDHETEADYEQITAELAAPEHESGVAPEQFTPIQPKKVMGVGLGNVTKAIGPKDS
eukprot:m.12236 g.12236  ORF g.12236 m.12236 type:complete len:488 (+) comp5813_c0_seq2:273-1736(+)